MISVVPLLLVITYFAQTNSILKLFECQGSWEQQSIVIDAVNDNLPQTEPYPPMRFNNYGVDISKLAHELIHKYDLCPFEELVFNCGFRNVSKLRLNQIIKSRNWVPKLSPTIPDNNNVNTPCQAFDPKKFLSLIANRKVLFAGDSLMFQTWSSLVCSLSKVSQIDEKSSIIKWKRDSWLLDACPLNKFHCHMDRGSIYFPEFNTTIMHYKFVIYHDTEDATVKKILEKNKMKKNDIVFYNFGLWIEDVKDYRRLVKDFTTEIHQLEKSASNVLPHFLFLETAPQHFPTPNGYFNRSDSALLWKSCQPLSLYTKVSSSNGHEPRQTASVGTSIQQQQQQHWREKYDWRNAVVRDTITNANVNVGIVSLAEGLSSQWDAHIDLIEKAPSDLEFDFVRVADCTHYCSHSAVFQFIKASLQHALRSI